MKGVKIFDNELESLSADERRALRASRFAQSSVKSPRGNSSQPKPPRLAHPGGAIATNKATALARYLKRKLESGEASQLDPHLVELAVRNAQSALSASTSDADGTQKRVRHVASFQEDGDDNDGSEHETDQQASRAPGGPRHVFSRLNGQSTAKSKPKVKKNVWQRTDAGPGPGSGAQQKEQGKKEEPDPFASSHKTKKNQRRKIRR